MIVCKSCLKEKDETEFYIRKGYGFYSVCKECHKKRCTPTTEEGKEKRRKRVKLWLKDNQIEKEKRKERSKKKVKED